MDAQRQPQDEARKILSSANGSVMPNSASAPSFKLRAMAKIAASPLASRITVPRNCSSVTRICSSPNLLRVSGLSFS